LTVPGDLPKELGKEALLPGQTATFANYTSYSRGINGIMVDIDGLADPDALGAADFGFRVGNDNNPDGWAAAPAPQSITVRTVAGVERVTIIWADNDWTTPDPEPGAIAKQWLQVTVLATANTGLPGNDVFYFGNAVGDGGNSTVDTIVNATDEIGARNHPHWFMDPAPIEDAYDYNRDQKVDATDQIIARNNQTFFLTDLNLITVPGPLQASMMAASADPSALVPAAAAVQPEAAEPYFIQWADPGPGATVDLLALGSTGWRQIADKIPGSQREYEWAPEDGDGGWHLFAARATGADGLLAAGAGVLEVTAQRLPVAEPVGSAPLLASLVESSSSPVEADEADDPLAGYGTFFAGTPVLPAASGDAAGSETGSGAAAAIDADVTVDALQGSGDLGASLTEIDQPEE
jgi:hypothetical protein